MYWTPRYIWVAARFRPGLVGIWISKLFQYFMGKSCLFVTIQSQVWGWQSDTVAPALMSVDRQCGSSRLHQWDIHLSHCQPPCGSVDLFPWCRNIGLWQLNYELIPNISSQLYSVEFGNSFFDMSNNKGFGTEMPSCRDTNMSFWKCNLPKKLR